IILTDIGRPADVLKSAVEEAISAAGYELGSDLIREPEAGGKIVVGSVNQSRQAAVSEADPLGGQSGQEAGRKRGVLSYGVDQILRRPGRIGNEVCLRSVVLPDG